MPKDLIHFKVALMTAQRLADTRFAPALARRQTELLLGSVIHDSLFYGVTKASRPLEPLAHRLHGAHGEDTHLLLRLQAGHAAAARDREPAAALLAGMASHLFADAVMHPLVWNLTGRYYADSPREKTLARQRHRALETLMDMIACPDMAGRPLFSLHRLLRAAGDALFDALPLDGLAALAGVAPDRVRTGLRSALRLDAALQAAYPCVPLAGTLYALMPALPHAAREIAALFYAPQWLAQADRITGDIAYRHPVTGEDASASLAGLASLAADRAAALCRRLEPAVFLGEAMDLPEPGPSMDAGLPGTSADSMRHFADPPFPKLP